MTATRRRPANDFCSFLPFCHLDCFLPYEVFYPGIRVEGLDLEGMTLSEAKQAISAKLEEESNQYGLVLRYGDKVWEYDDADLYGKFNLEEVLQEAYSVGRTGDILQRYGIIKGLAENPKSFDVSVTISVERLRSTILFLAGQINEDPVDARIEFHPQDKEKFTITGEKAGLRLDTDRLMKELEAAFETDTYVEMELKPEAVPPKVLAEELRLQTDRIASFYTVVTGSEGRKSNVFHAAAQFDGMVVKPGEVVSFNQTTGERTVANGYKAAPVIMADKSMQDDLGGGVCQTSTTVYNAVVRAGLKIEERWHHSFPSSYAEIGHDATVNWPNVDFKFSNDKDMPVYLHTYRSGNKLYIELYGKADGEYDEVKLESDLYAQYKAPSPTIVEDVNHQYVTYTDQKYTKVQSRPGYKVKTYRVYYYKDGREVRRELLSDDYYKPIAGTIYVGTLQRTTSP